MPTTVLPRPIAALKTLADLHRRLGDVPLDRIRMHPLPGTATEDDVLAAGREEGVTYELVDGVLVEKPMAFFEASLAAVLIRLIGNYLQKNRIGRVIAPDAQMQLRSGLVRSPDVSFFASARFPDGRIPKDAIPQVVPDLAVEILSRSNTKREIDRKRREFFRAGTRVMWIVDPDRRSVKVYTSPREFVERMADETLDGGVVLPGFQIRIEDWFSEAEQV